MKTDHFFAYYAALAGALALAGSIPLLSFKPQPSAASPAPAISTANSVAANTPKL